MTEKVYKIDQNISRLEEVLSNIPLDTTILVANNCNQFYDLKGLNKLPALHSLFLNGTAIDANSLRNITPQITYIEMTRCPYINSYATLPNNPLLIIKTQFKGESIIDTLPSKVRIWNLSEAVGVSLLEKHQLPSQVVQKIQETQRILQIGA